VARNAAGTPGSDSPLGCATVNAQHNPIGAINTLTSSLGVVHLTGWAFKPQYDQTLKSLEWAFRLKGEDSAGESINYNTRLLGRHGVMEVLVLTSPENLTGSVADFKAKLPGFKFNAGQTYAEFRDGDKVAEYGLAALVTGGAAAVAAKKGFFAAIGVMLLKMWKLVLVGLAAIGAGFKKFFGRKEDQA